MQEIDENGTPMPSTSPKKSDLSASHDDRAARIMAALISAQKENDEKRKKLQEDYEKAKAQYEAEKAILLAAAQESKRSMQNAGQIEVMPSEVIDEEDIEDELFKNLEITDIWELFNEDETPSASDLYNQTPSG